MGCVNSTAFDDRKRPRKKTKKRQDDDDEEEDFSQEIKLLILGAGESGKSTILKQMKIIYDTGFNDKEKHLYRSTVFTNTIQSVKVILRAMELLSIPYSKTSSRVDAQQFLALSEHCLDGEFPKDLSDIIKRLLHDAGIQECLRRSTEYQLNDSAHYYLNSIDRISMSHYVPTQNDIVRTRAKTTGITDYKFRHRGEVFRIIDVGGQRSERKKWTNVFNSVTAIIFCAAMSEYDLRLEEDPEMNRLQESLELFGSICSYKSFATLPIILFLNKYDIFEQKIPEVPLCNTFPEYKGPNDFESCAAYVKLLFESRKGDPDREIYTQYTNATSTENISFVFNCCTDIISFRNLKEIFDY